MITVACVEVSNYMGRGTEYVAKLKAMVDRNLSAPHRFVCLTDVPQAHPGIKTIRLPFDDKTGWWAKLTLFQPLIFSGRVLYSDLDNVIVGPLDELVEHKGIIHLDGWGWDEKVYGSAVMVWDGGEHAEIWDNWVPDVPAKFDGDQRWITHLGGWDALPFPLVCSAKYHCKAGPPAGASVVAFHGQKKPHNSGAAWVAEAWR